MLKTKQIMRTINQLKDQLNTAILSSKITPNKDSINELIEALEDCQKILLTGLNNPLSLSSSGGSEYPQRSRTKLIHREDFKEQLTQLIQDCQRNHEQYTLCYIDIDQFKVINDACGHLAGEQLLQHLVEVLKQQIQEDDLLAYLGGDEFGLLLHQNPLQAQPIIDKISKKIEAIRFFWQDKILTISVSIGLATVDCNSSNWSYVLSTAELACQVAKGKGRNQWMIHHCDDQELLHHRSERQWVIRLQQAIRDNRFFLYCQKIAPINNKGFSEHYEILLRLIDETGQIILPGIFIPIAERYDLMPLIDRWVINEFLNSYQNYYQGQILNRRGHKIKAPNCTYTINLSAASINNEQFLDFLREKIIQSQIPPQSLCFEITETTAIVNFDRAAHFIEVLKELGCRFALDDFGIGMSSLAYLKNLPVDYLKIDGSFVKNMAENPIDCMIVEFFNQIGHAMEMKTIAEFVEKESVVTILQNLGVDYAQGYGIALPSPFSFN